MLSLTVMSKIILTTHGVENPLWGFTILFCCGIFRVIQRLRSRYFEVCFFEVCLSWKFDEVAKGVNFHSGEIGDLSVAPVEKISSCFFPGSFEPLRDVFPLFMSHVGLALKEHKLNFQQWSSTLLIFDGPVTYFSGQLVSL